MNKRFLARFWQDQAGAEALEFAIVAVVFLTMFAGIIEYGLYTLTQVALESAVAQAGRVAALGNTTQTGCATGDRVCVVEKTIAQKTGGLINPSKVKVTAAVVNTGNSGTTIADICIVPGQPPQAGGQPTNNIHCDCPGCTYQEVPGSPNPNAYDNGSDPGNNSVGKPGDMVEVRASYLWTPLFFGPFFSKLFFGDNDASELTSSIVIKNEPFPCHSPTPSGSCQ